MGSSKRFCCGLKICVLVTFVLLVIISVVLVILYFTVFKPVILESIRWIIFPIQMLNITLGMVVHPSRKSNYGSFKYQESTAYVSYRGDVVAEAPIEADTIPARGKHNINTTVTMFEDKLLSDDNFKREFLQGSILNFTSKTTLHGKVILFKLIKAKASSSSTCDISIFVQEQQAESICKSKVSL
ncbi:hypothetical protein NC652_027290 [Populus alba x Populus x berolinensis]|nr:hypothetical protein NC652_027290 [Populus alba x Populus x berolinensis]